MGVEKVISSKTEPTFDLLTEERRNLDDFCSFTDPFSSLIVVVRGSGELDRSTSSKKTAELGGIAILIASKGGPLDTQHAHE